MFFFQVTAVQVVVKSISWQFLNHCKSVCRGVVKSLSLIIIYTNTMLTFDNSYLHITQHVSPCMGFNLLFCVHTSLMLKLLENIHHANNCLCKTPRVDSYCGVEIPSNHLLSGLKNIISPKQSREPVSN